MTSRQTPLWFVPAMLLMTTLSAYAGPYETGSTSTAQGIKFKSSVQWKHSGDKDSWVLPKIVVGGPLSERLEVSIGTGYGVVDRAGGRSRGGLRDLSLGMKWRLRDEGAGRAAVTIEPGLSVPTGADGIGKDGYALELPVRAGRRFGAFRLTGEVAMARTFGQHDDTLAGGALVEFAAPTWSCGMELVADTPRDHTDRWHLRTNAGVKRKVGKHVEWQALLGRSIENRAGARQTTIKLAFEYKL